MDWDIIAPMIVSIVLFVTVGGVILLRPLSTRLADLLEVMAQERRELPGIEQELSGMREAMSRLESRLELLEERQDFTDSLLASGDDSRKELGASGETGTAEG